MKRFYLQVMVLGSVFLAICSSWAIDVNPSKDTVPEKFTNPKGKRFSIFAGDPARVQRANEVNVKDFEGKIELAKKDISLVDLKTMEATQGKVLLDLTFIVKNKGNRNYILSFPDAERYDINIKNSAGEVIYTWSEDKEFVKEVGQSFINKNESLAYTPNPPVDITALLPKLKEGDYTISATLSNYPEIRAEAVWHVSAQPIPIPQPVAVNL